jgi:hypothetical protein
MMKAFVIASFVPTAKIETDDFHGVRAPGPLMLED